MGILQRICNVQNSKKQLSWGHCVLTPPVKCSEELAHKPEAQFVLVCGHSYYRIVKTLILEIYSDDKVGVFVENENHRFDCILAYGSEDFAVERIIYSLKEWFPAKEV